MPKTPTRRTMLAWAGLAALPATAVLAQETEEHNPTDFVPRRFTPEEFSRLSANELYKVKLAVRRGRTILIDGYTASESRKMIEDAKRSD